MTTDASGSTAEPTPLTPSERRQILGNAITGLVAQGYRIESQTDTMAALVKGKPVNHILHLLLGFPTLGFWWLVWIFLIITGGEKRSQVLVQPNGQVIHQKL